jgi:hypothetical protein
MISREILVKKIEILPPYLLQEVADYIEFVEYKKYRKSNAQISDITLASEKSLSKDWLKPEEDEAWEDL